MGTLHHLQDEFKIQSFADNIHSGMGGYQPRYLTRKLPYGFHGYAMACLKIEDNWHCSDELIKILFFNDECHQVDLADITDPEPEAPPEEMSPLKIDAQTQKRLSAQVELMQNRLL